MKEKNPERIHRVNINLTPEEYSKLEKEWKTSLCKHLGVYVRNILFSRPIVMTVRNRSMDELMEETIRLKNELKAIGDRFNQTILDGHLLQQNSEYRRWLVAYSLDKEILFNKIDEMKKIFQKMAEPWLH